MKKKILLGVAAGVMMALGSASPTHADIDPSPRAGCVIRNQVLNVPDISRFAVNHSPEGSMRYYACGNYIEMINVVYRVHVSPAGDCAQDFIEEYRFNMDSIGHWDPLMKVWPCDHGRADYVLNKTAPEGSRVYLAGPDNEKCTIAHFHLGADASGDREADSAKKCVIFSNG